MDTHGTDWTSAPLTVEPAARRVDILTNGQTTVGGRNGFVLQTHLAVVATTGVDVSIWHDS